MVDTISQDLRHALRRLVKDRGFAAATLTTLVGFHIYVF